MRQTTYRLAWLASQAAAPSNRRRGILNTQAGSFENSSSSNPAPCKPRRLPTAVCATSHAANNPHSPTLVCRRARKAGHAPEDAACRVCASRVVCHPVTRALPGETDWKMRVAVNACQVGAHALRAMRRTARVNLASASPGRDRSFVRLLRFVLLRLFVRMVVCLFACFLFVYLCERCKRCG